MEKIKYTETIKSKKSPIINYIKFILLWSLILTNPDFSKSSNENFKQNDISNSIESREIDKRDLIKNAVAKAIEPINDLNQIPEWGLELKYDWTYSTDLPDKINFFPKEIKWESLWFTLIQIWEKLFLVKPDLWFKITEMYLDSKWFHTTVESNTLIVIRKTVSKNKEKELWEYIAKLYIEWEEWKYTLSEVNEIEPERQAEAIKKLDEINK